MKILDFSNLKGDLFGGLTASIVALPISIAFGVQSGLGAEAGIYGAIAVGIVAALVGGCQTQVSGPTGPMTVVSTGFILIMISKYSGLDNAIPMIILTFFLAGAIQLLLGVMRIGKYISYIPDPVVSGFMNGIGVIIVAFQLNGFFGTSIEIPSQLDVFGMELGVSKVIGAFACLPEMIAGADWQSMVLALGTIVIIYVLPRITKVLPATLVALVIMTYVSYFTGMEVAKIGEIPSAFPPFQMGKVFGEGGVGISDVWVALGPALTLGTLGIIDSLLTAVVADRMSKTHHNSDREIIGQGLGNMVSAMFGGLPGAGSTMRTVTNIKSGGKTNLSGVMHGLMLLGIILIGGPVAKHIPKPVLAGILITVGISLPDYSSFKDLRRIPRPDNVVTFVVFALTVAWDLLYATAIGLILAALQFMKKMADIVELGSQETKTDRMVHGMIQSFPDAHDFESQVYFKNLKGPVFFGFAFRFKHNIATLPDVKAIIFNLGEVPYMDKSGLITFRDAVTELVDKGKNVCISEPSEEVLDLLKKNRIIPEIVDDRHLFESVEECVMWLHEPGHLDNIFEADDELYIPSAYSPNGDGINDEWQIRNIDKYPNCEVRISNRDGKVVFYSRGYEEMWEGLHEGRMLPADTYDYEIDLNGDNSGEIRKGTVTIFR